LTLVSEFIKVVLMEIMLIKGDITQEKTDAIVNAANNALSGGGGVDGAIHRAGGPVILRECQKIRTRQGKCPTGEAVHTPGGNLSAKYVIHTVGPIWRGGIHQEEELLASCYQRSFELAEKLECESLAFPNISTGIYSFPKKLAAEIAVRTVRSFEARSVKLIKFICFDDENYRLYRDLLA
jgi:O-acetyl-ADP-ribose deacetylase (regulator of RNase III)